MKRTAVLIFMIVTAVFSKAQSSEPGDSLSMLLDNYLTSANNAYRLNGSVFNSTKRKNSFA